MRSEQDRRPSPGAPGACPDAELLARYVDDALESRDRAEVERHLASCGDCRGVVMEAAAFVTAPAVDVQTPWLRRGVEALALAAGIALVVWLWPNVVRDDDLERREGVQALIDAVAKEPVRPVEGRLTGAFPFAPPPAAIRGAAETTGSRDVRIAIAAIERAVRGHGADGQADVGVAYLVGGDLDEAVASLQRAALQASDRARALNDLSVAYLARGTRTRNADDFSRALAAADEALTLRPRLPEAVFNRALVLERLSRPEEAISAWTLVQQLEPASSWAAEAGTHIRTLRP